MRIKLSDMAELSTLGLPYVRGTVSEAHVKDLAVALVDGLSKSGRIPFAEKFDVMKLSQPVQGSDHPKLLKAWEAGVRYAILNGHHRIRAIRRVMEEVRPNEKNGIEPGKLDIEAIEMTVHEPMGLGEIKAFQIAADAECGLKITTEQREAAIKSLADDDDWTQARIAKEFGLSQASVSRICAGKQTFKQLGLDRAGRRKGGKKAKAKRRAWDAAAWIEALVRHGVEGVRHHATVTAYLTEHGKAHAAALKKLAAALDDYTKTASTPRKEKASAA
jgi:predicted XRE-type DNA-binding protein